MRVNGSRNVWQTRSRQENSVYRKRIVCQLKSMMIDEENRIIFASEYSLLSERLEQAFLRRERGVKQ